MNLPQTSSPSATQVITENQNEANQSPASSAASRGELKQRKHSPFASVAIAARERLLRRPEVEHLTGLSRSSLYRLIEAKQFPPSVKLSKSAAAWPLSAIDAWISARISAGKTDAQGGE